MYLHAGDVMCVVWAAARPSGVHTVCEVHLLRLSVRCACDAGVWFQHQHACRASAAGPSLPNFRCYAHMTEGGDLFIYLCDELLLVIEGSKQETI